MGGFHHHGLCFHNSKVIMGFRWGEPGTKWILWLAFECVAWAGNRRGRIKLEKAQEEDHFSLEQVTARSTKRADAFLSLCHQAFALVPVPDSTSSSSSSSFQVTLNLKNSDTRM